MKHLTVLLLILSLFISSCSTVNLKARAGKDVFLSSVDHEKFKGAYSNLPIDTNYRRRGLYCYFTKGNKDTLCIQKQYSVEIIPVDAKTLTVNLNDNEMLIQRLTLKGKYKKGYFKAKRQFLFSGVVGPLVWVFGENINYLGLSKDNNLVVLNSGGAGVLFFIVLPIFVAGGNKHDHEYRRIK